MIKGSCHCKEVAYSIDGELGPISHCYCHTCRKTHASPLATVARIKKNRFRITKGKEALTAFKTSENKIRYFCSKCGSQVYADYLESDDVVLMLGTLDDDPGSRPVRHIFVGEKSPWYEIDAKLKIFDAWPTS